MTPLPRLDATSWPEEIAEVVREFFNCTIDILLPASAGTYNPATDTYSGGAEPTKVLASRPARAQHIRLPLEQAGAYEWSTKRRYRFQMELLPGDPVIRKGMVVRVTDGGRDPSLVDFAFEVASASNSSHAAVRTIETLTDLGTAA